MKNTGAAFSLRENLGHLFAPPRSNFKPVDGLRALSVLWVMLVHSLWWQYPFIRPEDYAPLLDNAPRWIVGGPYGVDVFFVISGFLIGLMLMREHEERGRIDVKRFYLRRFMRLMPAYFVSLAVYAVVVGVNNDMIWANLLYVNNFIPGEKQAMVWAWSLAIEEQFYFTFPLFLLFLFYPLRRHRLALLLAVLGLAFAIRALVVYRWDIYAPVPWSLGVGDRRFLDWAEQMYIKPYTRFGCLVLGVLAAHLHLTGHARRFFAGRPAAAAAGLLLSLAAVWGVVMAPVHVASPRWPPLPSFLFMTTYQYILGAGVAYVMMYSLHPAGRLSRLVNRLLALRVWYPVAQLSYSAYLLNPMVLILFYALLAPHGLAGFPLAVLSAAGVVLTLLASLVIYLCVERPFMNLRDLRRERAADRTLRAVQPADQLRSEA